jgi:SP family general alpha glucoside:H+ symporter-like MFS transporter
MATALTLTQINSFFGHPAFRERFGSRTATGELYIPANWQSAINNGGMAWMIAAIFIPVFSTSLGMLFAGEVVCGVVSTWR